MIRRWAKPVRPEMIETTESVATADTGRATLDARVKFNPDDVERMRLGYVCIRCWEPHESPFPDRCDLCTYPMRAEQPAEFERAYKGSERNPRAVLIEKELAALDDKHERTFHTNRLGIIVPNSIKE